MPATMLENLPNVTIRNITIENSKESKNFMIHAEVVVHGFDAPSPAASWITDDFLLSHLNLVIIKSSVPEFNRDVSSGIITIDAKNINTYSNESGDIVLKDIALKQKVKQLRDNSEAGTNSCIVNVVFEEKSESDSVFLFAMTSINITSISHHYGVDLKSSEIQTYMGPIVSESIIKDGSLVTHSNVLRLQNGQLYNGPFHFHSEGGYMVGSYHSDRSHPPLTLEIVSNTKIKDNRVKTYSDYNFNNIEDLKKISAFSMLYPSFNNSNHLCAMFSINVHNIMLTRTKYGRLLFNLKPEAYESLLLDFKIKNMKIYKRRVKQLKNNKKISRYLSRDLLIDSKDFTNEVKLKDKTKLVENGSLSSVVEQGTQKIVESQDMLSNNSTTFVDTGGITRTMSDFRLLSALKEEHLVSLLPTTPAKYIRTFSFSDFSEKRKFSEKYIFELDMTFYDPSIAALQNILQEIQDSASELERYINLATNRKNYDFKNRKIKEEYIEDLYEQSTPENYPWIKSVAVYSKYISLMKSVSELEQERISSNLYGFLSPHSFQVKSAKTFLYKFKQLSCKFMKYFKISNSMMQNMVSKNSQKIYQNANFTDIDINHEFSSVMDYKQGRNGLYYFSSIDSAPTNYIFYNMTKDSFIQRMVQEAAKLNATGYEKIMPYISPNIFSWGGTNSRLSDNSMSYVDIFSDIQQDDVISEETNFVPSNWQHVPNYNVNNNYAPFPVESDEDYRLASDYIGSRYGTLTSDEIDEEYLPNAYQVSTPPNQGPLGSIFSPDDQQLQDAESYATMASENDINGVPIVHQKYFLDSLKNISSPLDIDRAIFMMKTVQKVQYKENYSGKLSALSKENWTDLTPEAMNTLTGDIVCRMVPAEISAILGPSNFRVYNNFFIISFPRPTEVTITPDETIINQLVSIDNSTKGVSNDYLIGNLIRQPLGRDGVNAGFNYFQGPTRTESSTFVTGVGDFQPEPSSFDNTNRSIAAAMRERMEPMSSPEFQQPTQDPNPPPSTPGMMEDPPEPSSPTTMPTNQSGGGYGY